MTKAHEGMYIKLHDPWLSATCLTLVNHEIMAGSLLLNGGPPSENSVKICLYLVVILAYSCKYFANFACLLVYGQIFHQSAKKVDGAGDLSNWRHRCAPLPCNYIDPELKKEYRQSGYT